MFELDAPLAPSTVDPWEEAKDIILDTAKQCKRIARLKKHELHTPKHWTVTVRLYNREYGRSWGNRHGIKIAMWRHRDLPDRNLFREYASFNSDPVIGGFTATDWRLPLKATVCHEMAHCAQRNGRAWLRYHRPQVDWDKPHGRGFRMIYAIFRRELVNPYI